VLVLEFGFVVVVFCFVCLLLLLFAIVNIIVVVVLLLLLFLLLLCFYILIDTQGNIGIKIRKSNIAKMLYDHIISNDISIFF
jgi:hypothetical protein